MCQCWLDYTGREHFTCKCIQHGQTTTTAYLNIHHQSPRFQYPSFIYLFTVKGRCVGFTPVKQAREIHNMWLWFNWIVRISGWKTKRTKKRQMAQKNNNCLTRGRCPRLLLKNRGFDSYYNWLGFFSKPIRTSIIIENLRFDFWHLRSSSEKIKNPVWYHTELKSAKQSMVSRRFFLSFCKRSYMSEVKTSDIQ